MDQHAGREQRQDQVLFAAGARHGEDRRPPAFRGKYVPPRIGRTHGDTLAALDEGLRLATATVQRMHDFARSGAPKLQRVDMAPVLRNDLLTAGGSTLSDTLNAVSAKLTTDQLTQMGVKVDVNKENPATVAKQFLQDNGLI